MKITMLVSTAMLGMVISMNSMACKSMADRVCLRYGKDSAVCKEYQRVCGGRTLKSLDSSSIKKLNSIVRDSQFKIEITSGSARQ